MPSVSRDEIIEYYEQCETDYRFLWDLKKSRAMHYGLWESDVRDLPRALERQNEVMAARADIRSEDRILDAGCGVGGSSLFLARRLGCRVTGVSLSPGQISRAREFARQEGLEDGIRFRVADYCKTGLPAASFDVIWAIESVCHAPDKLHFAREAFRLLKPGGRLVMMDGFLASRDMSSAGRELMRSWLRGWAVGDLEVPGVFLSKLSEAGFEDASFQDHTHHVIPSARRLYWLSIPGQLLGSFAGCLGLRNRVQAGNVRAARDQFRAIRRKLWTYGLVFAVKPKEHRA